MKQETLDKLAEYARAHPNNDYATYLHRLIGLAAYQGAMTEVFKASVDTEVAAHLLQLKSKYEVVTETVTKTVNRIGLKRKE